MKAFPRPAAARSGLLALLLALALVPLAARPAGAQGERVLPGRYLVVLHEGQPVDAVAPDLVGRAGGRMGTVFRTALQGFAAELTPAAAWRIAQDPRVAYVEEDREVWTTAELPTGVDRMEADKNPTAGIDGTDQAVDVDVAVLDTGIAAHPDLTIAGGTNCSGFFGGCSGSSYSDGNGHGTHVAGTVAARDDGAGVVGVAPGARLWAVKVLRNNGSGSLSGIIAGIDWVAARASTIEVANMSLGCDCYSQAMDDALTRATNAGVVVVAAAGNSAVDGSGFTPAGNPQVIGVTAIADFNGRAGGGAPSTCRADVDDTLADFSSYGAAMDVAAPGVCINSTAPGGGYAELSGTSMASPHVAGAAALWIAERGVPSSGTRWSEVRSGLLTEWSRPQGDACGFREGRSPEPLLQLAACD
jgi:subtilisin family serine protease